MQIRARPLTTTLAQLNDSGTDQQNYADIVSEVRARHGPSDEEKTKRREATEEEQAEKQSAIFKRGKRFLSFLSFSLARSESQRGRRSRAAEREREREREFETRPFESQREAVAPTFA